MNQESPWRIQLRQGGAFLEGNYEVFLGKQAVGNVQVTKEGLYLRFQCRCTLSGDVCRLSVSCGGKEENLGVLVPNGNSFTLETRLPVKRLGQGTPSFFVVPNRPVLQGKFVPIRPEEPFSYIERLKNAHLVRQNGQVGIMIKDNAGK